MSLRIRDLLRRFIRNETGAVVAEGVIVLPLFIWAHIALYVYWDAFRSNNAVQKAAFTVADMLSREQTDISQSYVDGLSRVVEYLIDEDQAARIRVSSITYNGTNQQFEVHWSASSNNTMTPLTTETLQNYINEIPQMAPADYAIVLEVETDYEPAFDIGMADQVFREFVVTRPRFLPCLRLDGSLSCTGT